MWYDAYWHRVSWHATKNVSLAEVRRYSIKIIAPHVGGSIMREHIVFPEHGPTVTIHFCTRDGDGFSSLGSVDVPIPFRTERFDSGATISVPDRKALADLLGGAVAAFTGAVAG